MIHPLSFLFAEAEPLARLFFGARTLFRAAREPRPAKMSFFGNKRGCPAFLARDTDEDETHAREDSTESKMSEGSPRTNLPNMADSAKNIIDEHYQNLYRFAVSLCRSQTDAWDLTQETFLIWTKKGSAIRSKAATKSWLYTTLYREFLKTARRSSRFSSLEDQEFEAADPVAESEDIDKLDARHVMEMLSELKDSYRNVVTLYYLESYSYKEISKILDVPIGTVMSRLARGKEILKRKLKNADTPNNVVGFENQPNQQRYGHR